MSSAENEQKRISRREFIKGAAVGAAGVAGAGVLASCATPAPEVIEKTVEVPVEVIKEVVAKPWLPEKWDVETEVLVVGSGVAGLACAANAAINGAKVICIEANDKIGGKGILAGGNLGIGGGTRMQIEAGFEENADIIYQDRTDWTLRDDVMMEVEDVDGGVHEIGQWRRISGAEDAEGLSRVFADRSLDTWNWLDEIGCNFTEARFSPKNNVYRGSRAYQRTGAVLVDRDLKFGDENGLAKGGAGLAWPMYDVAVENGAEFLLEHKMTRIVREGDRSGRVLGVEVEAGGKTMYFKATKGVFLGTGSWNMTPELKVLFLPWLAKIPHVSGEPYVFNVGNGIQCALDIGAGLTTDRGSDWHGWHRHAGTLWHSMRPPFGLPGTSEPEEGSCIYVNADGNRFMNEEIGEDNPAWIGGNPPYYFAQICALQPIDEDGPIVWIILDEAAREEQGLEIIVDVNVYPEMYASAATIDELASKIGVPAAALNASVSRYNELVAGGEDVDFGKRELTAGIETPPFHALKWGIQKHNTLGGVTIDDHGRVKDFYNKVIPGFYAAGECAGGMDLIGLSRPILFGRVAGEWLAKESA